MPPLNAGERTTLESWLEFHRATLAIKCEGLDDSQAASASAAPSGLTLTGLVQHMADTGPVLRHQSARQGGGGAAGGAFGGRMLRDRPEERFVVAGLVVHPRRPHWLSKAVDGQHRAGGAIDGEPAHMGQVAR